MTTEGFANVRVEMERMKTALDTLDTRMTDNEENMCAPSLWRYPRETGAIRRASLDLTRALANMRKP